MLSEEVRAAVHMASRLDEFPKWCRTVDDRVHQNAEFVLHTISGRRFDVMLPLCGRTVVGLRPRTSRVEEFGTRWSGTSVDYGRPARTSLQ